MASNTRIKIDLLTAAFFLAAAQGFLPSQGYAGTDKAVATPAPAVSGATRRAQELWERGDAYAQKGLMKRAQEYRDAARQLDPQVDVAAPSNTVSGGKAGVDENLARAKDACDRKDYALALKYVDTVESLDPAEPRVQALRERATLVEFQSEQDPSYDPLVKGKFDEAVAEYRRQDYAAAREKMIKAVEMDPRNAQVLSLKKLVDEKMAGKEIEERVGEIRVEWEKGDRDTALEMVGDLLQQYPGAKPALDLKKEIEASAKKEEAQQAQESLKRARQMEKDGKYMAARKEYEKVLKADPGNKEAAQGLERVKGLVEPLQAKLAELEKAVKAGDKPKAEKLVAEIKELDPDNARLKTLEKKAAGLGPKTTALDAEAKADEAYKLGKD